MPESHEWKIDGIRMKGEPDGEGSILVTSPDFEGLLSEGNTLAEAMENSRGALAAVVIYYEETMKPLPAAYKPEVLNQ